ncbi:MAG: DUF4326 domain-containing protein [Candidatus Cloacimonetes bacterium]|jgi:hypothetical protein|nr:DUF4326 domain-containing protein [Candidatus Cloacimonadota bacterium]
MAGKVVHFKKSKFDVYIGRPSIWGNPWSFKGGTIADFIVDTREESIVNYEKWLKGTDFTDIFQDQRKQILKRLPSIKGKILGCWCYPRKCHGDILVKMADSLKSDFTHTVKKYEESQDSTAADGRA